MHRGINRWSALSFIAFWIATAIIIIRRPQTPTKTDLFLIRWGYFLTLFAMAVFTVFTVFWLSEIPPQSWVRFFSNLP